MFFSSLLQNNEIFHTQGIIKQALFTRFLYLCGNREDILHSL